MSLFTAPMMDLELDGKKVGYLLSASWSTSDDRQKIYPIGERWPVEAAFVGSDVNDFRANTCRITDSDLASRSLVPAGRATTATVVAFPQLTAVIRDKVGGKIQHQLEGVYITMNSYSMAGRGVMSNDISLTALRHVYGSELG